MSLTRRLALFCLLALPACTSPNPNLYTLAPVPGPLRRKTPRYVEVRDPALPHYLERSEIVRSSEDFRLDVLRNDWWGESLATMLDRVLVQDLGQRMPDSTVFPEIGAISTTPDATVAVNIQRFDMDRSGALLLEGQVWVRHGRTATRHVRLTRPVMGPGTAALVSAMSSAVGELADVIATMLAGGSAAA
jgi:uncharacterized lipoprotein YmbA